jgi:NAD+ synthase
MFDAVKVKNDCIQWIRDWFEKNGKDCKACVGISGGKDSSVVAALCCEALGKDRVIGVLMPNGVQNDIADAFKVVEFLDIQYATIDINNTFKSILNHLIYLNPSTSNMKHILPTEQAVTNLPPRIRMATLYAISQSLNGRVACTDNLSESYIGYSTRWGDSVGDFSPLLHLTSEGVVAIGDALGLPYDLTHKTPSDGLCGKTDEDNFGFTYEALNKYIRTGVCEDTEVKEKIDKKHQKNLFKLQPIPSFPYDDKPFIDEVLY